MNVQPYRAYALIGVLWLLTTAALTGCVTTDITPETPRQGILVANAEVEGANLLLRSLFESGAIPATEARKVAETLKRANTELKTALDVLERVGDPTAAEDGLERAKIALQAALIVLAEYGGTS